jgi:hypothetical protein
MPAGIWRHRRKQRLPRRIYETTKTLTTQFAPQGRQAEQSATEQRNCRAAIGHRSDLEREVLVRSSPPRVLRPVSLKKDRLLRKNRESVKSARLVRNADDLARPEFTIL